MAKLVLKLILDRKISRPKLHPLYPLIRMRTKTLSVLYESFFTTEKVMCTKVNLNEKIKLYHIKDMINAYQQAIGA